jgi:hypothetical protein
VVYLRHRRLPAELAPAPWATLALWAVTGITALAMTALVLIQLGIVKP